jgi:hypothetical protein
LDVYLERGQKKTFAIAVDWPGWARSGKDEPSALAALLDYGPRYRRSLGLRAPTFEAPTSIEDLKVVERVEGNATTDFGAPGAIRKADADPPDQAELDRLIDLLRRAWAAFDAAAEKAAGEELAPAGPRGGGRSVAKMRSHVHEADGGYLNALGGRASNSASSNDLRDIFVEAARARARGELPDEGPRGGKRWPARFAVRRSAWHALDHAWEIEDRTPG